MTTATFQNGRKLTFNQIYIFKIVDKLEQSDVSI